MSLIVYIFSVFFPCRRNSSALRVRGAGHALNLNKGCTKRQSLPNCQQNGRPGREYRPGKQDARCYFVRNGAATKVRRADAFLRKDRPTEPAAERHGKQLPQTRRPGFRGYKSRDPDRTAAERGAARRRGTDKGDGVRATQQAMNSGRQVTGNGRQGMDNGQQGIDNGQQGIDNGRRITSGGRWTMNGKTRNDRRKTRRNTDEGGRPDKAGEMRTERNTGKREMRTEGDTGREKHGQREMRAKGNAGRQEKDGRREERRGKERCGEDRQDSGVRRQKKQACATAGPTTRPEGRHTIFISARPEYASQRRESSYRPA